MDENKNENGDKLYEYIKDRIHQAVNEALGEIKVVKRRNWTRCGR